MEFAWASCDPAIRWTAEVAGPEVPPAKRLDHAIGVLRSLGHEVDPPPSLRRVVVGARRFGAWLGGRHAPAGDRYKLYVELPAGEAGTFAADLLPVDVALAVPPRVEWRMVGFDCERGDFELYGRIARQELWELDRVLIRCGLEADALRPLTEDLFDLQVSREVLPGMTGLSISVSPDNTVVSAGWFAFAQFLLGSERTTIQRLAQTIDRFGWDDRHYHAICGAGADGGQRYGMIGVGISPSGVPRLHVGCRP